MIKRPHHSRRPRSNTAVELAEIDTGIRQCLQLLMSCEAIQDQEPAKVREYWMKLAERAWRDFEDDKTFAEGKDGESGKLDFT